MTSPDPKSTPSAPRTEGEGGGLLPALLAGAGILLVAGLFIFGGDDKAQEASEAEDQKGASASAQTANGPRGGVASRPTDDATKTSRARPRLNPRIANAVVTEGMAPSPNKKPEPTSFDSVEEEIAYWEGELEAAHRELEVRERAAEIAPKKEAETRANGTPEQIAQLETRLKIVADNLARAEARVAEIEGKLAALRGG